MLKLIGNLYKNTILNTPNIFIQKHKFYELLYLPKVVNDTSFTLFNGCGLSVAPRFTML